MKRDFRFASTSWCTPREKADIDKAARDIYFIFS
jgi:hypothetical protein